MTNDLNPNALPSDILSLAQLCHDSHADLLRLVRLQLKILTAIEALCVKQLEAQDS